MRILIGIILLFIGATASAQYGNDWIDYSQPHYIIKVQDNGIHRISASTLSNSGLNFIEANNFKMFRDGVEIPIHVNGSGTNVNYIEFYGYPNDGQFDTTLFRNPNDILNKNYSMFSGTAVYYLTYNSIGGNLRINSTSNDLTNLPAVEEYYIHTQTANITNARSTGEPTYISGGTLYNSLFLDGEGFFGNNSHQINNTTLLKSYNLNTNHFNTNGPSAILRTTVVGTTTLAHEFNVKIGSSILSNESFADYSVRRTEVTLADNLVAPLTVVDFESVPTSSGTNRNTVAMVQCEYPKSFNFDNQSTASFTLTANGSDQYIEITDFNDSGTQPILYDVSNGYRIVSSDSPGSVIHRFRLPAAVGERTIILRANSASSYFDVTTINQLGFTDYSNLNNQGNLIFLSHNSLISSQEFNEYKQYRESIIGGNYTVSIIDVEQLYHQFGYGIDKHPQAIRNFISYAKNEWSFEPEFVFIIGKGREYPSFRTDDVIRAQCLIPTFGSPGSDNLLATVGSSSVPIVPIGRLAAKTPAEITIYLEKVIQYEEYLRNVGDPYQTVANKDFQKQIIHFGGGNGESQQNLFKNYLNSYKIIAEDTLWGANTLSVFKTNSNPLQNVQSDFLRDKIDNGVSLITFFGHSYAGGFDVSFDEPENYTNVGKYPIYLANGCNAGIIHGAFSSISERFILAEQKGAISYISTTDLSASSSLNLFTQNFYQNFSRSSYGSTVGAIMQETIEDVEQCCESYTPNMMTAQEMTLHGDPAIRINQYDEPDYNIEAQNVFFEPAIVSTSTDSFSINLDVYNLGKAIRDSFTIEVKRTYPDGVQDVFVATYPATLYRDTFSFRMPTSNGLSGLGLNQFDIYVDVNDDIQNELSETNNYLLNQINLLVGSEDIFPIYPYEFAIVPNQGVTLKASTGNPLASIANYTFQVDTSELFLNPLSQDMITSSGGVVEYTPTISMSDSTVYYWRVGRANSSNPNWKYSSFIYLANEFPGWNQSHYYQWLKDDFQNIYLDQDRVFKFEEDVKEIFVQTGNTNFNEMKWVLNGSKQHNWSMNNCGGGVGYSAGFTIAVIDNLTGLPKEVVNASTSSHYGPFGNVHCIGVSDVKTVANFPAFGTTIAPHPSPGTPWADLILDYLNNEVDAGNYVIIYSINNPRFDLMSPSLFDFFNDRGASVSSTTAGPMILAYRENGLASTNIAYELGNGYGSVVNKEFIITGTWNSGNFESTIIGPAEAWGSFHWKYSSLEDPTGDNQFVEIYGVENENHAGDLLLTVDAQTLDTIIDFIDASFYPYLRLKLQGSDEIDRTPLQADYWRVIYDEAPELAINPNKHFVVTADTVEQGTIWHVEVALENVSVSNMDSTKNKIVKQYGDNSISTNFTENRSLPSLDTLHLSVTENTLSEQFTGTNLISIEANPLDADHKTEQFHFNNFLNIDFDVLGDKENPLLDVTFDGIHILDGDIVSSKPEIEIELKDENLFLLLDDTSLLDIYFRQVEPSLGGLERISFASNDVVFVLASSGGNQNKALVNIQKEFPNDGKYELIVRSSDKTGNSSSGTSDRLIELSYYDYKISFEVINETQISNVLNYPNPFTTSTQFVFTLTGSEIPDYMEIRIMNVKGTVVRQITMDELGPIHIGQNRTEYAWDGRDDYGDVMANGVYFYKIISSLDQQEIEHFDIQQVDRFFERGIGKMVMIR